MDVAEAEALRPYLTDGVLHPKRGATDENCCMIPAKA